MYIIGCRILLQAAVARVADDADDLALAFGGELAHHALADHQPLVERILVLEELLRQRLVDDHDRRRHAVVAIGERRGRASPGS